MAFYELSYRLQFDTLEGDTVNAYIRDTTTENELSDPHVVVDLKPAGDPVVIATVDNEEEKFTALLGQRCTLTFLSSNSYNLTTFTDNATDRRYLVEVYLAGALVFTGFLSLEDCSEDFADPSQPYAVSLEAVDGLALLKDIPLVKPDGTNPKGKFRIIELMSWCLKLTGVELPIVVANNQMEEYHPGLPAWDHIYLDAKTFEDGIGVSLDCYEVLTRILKDCCFLTQLKGAWWVRRLDEYLQGSNYVDNYDADGVYGSTTSGMGLQQLAAIGPNGTIKIVQTAPTINIRQRVGRIRDTYQYEYPKEVVNNIDFTRGGIYTPLLPPPDHAFYRIDDWTLFRGLTNPVQTVTTVAYIDRRFEDNYEKERYVVIAPDTTGNTAPHELRSSRFPISAGDKIRFSVDRRYAEDFDDGSGSFIDPVIGSLRLWTGSTVRSFDPELNKWINNGVRGFKWTFNSHDDNENEWVNFSMTTTEAPVDGEVELILYQNDRHIDTIAIHFANVQVEYIPKINGSYQKYTGQYNQINESAGFKSVREEQVYISDAPKKLFKGAMFRLVGGNYQLAGRWYDGNNTAIRNAPTDIYLHPIGFLQIYELYNQFNRPFRSLDATLRGFGGELPTPVYAYRINYPSTHTANKIFRLLHYELHLASTEWTGYFAEHYDTNLYHSYLLDGWSFKYLEER